MFSSIQDQLAAYKLPRPPLLRNISQVQELPTPRYEFTPIAPLSKPINVPQSLQPSVSPRKLNGALPIKFQQPMRPLAASLLLATAAANTPAVPLHPSHRSFPIFSTAPVPSLPISSQKTLPRSRASARKHHIFNDKIYKSTIRSNSRKQLQRNYGETLSQTDRHQNHQRLDSRLFNQSIGSNRFYNHTEEKQDGKMRFPRKEAASEREDSSGESENSAIRHLEKPEMKAIESRLMVGKNTVRSPSNRTDKSNPKRLSIPKTRKKKLESKDYNELAADIQKHNRFFDSQKTNFGERQTSKPTMFFNPEFGRQVQTKPTTPVLSESLEEMLRKLDKRSKIIALLVIILVLALVIYQIIR